MNVAVLSANLGGYDRERPWPDLDTAADVHVEVIRLTDRNCPPRPLAMTARLQCGIPKWFGWELYPGCDAYLWIDASCTPEPSAVSWFLHRLGSAEIAVFQHPERYTIAQEVDFMRERMKRPGETYLNSRYAGEWLVQQAEAIFADKDYSDNHLYASTAFIYRPTQHVKAAFRNIWADKARYCLHDQLAMPYELWKAGVEVAVMPESYMDCPALRYVRNQR